MLRPSFSFFSDLTAIRIKSLEVVWNWQRWKVKLPNQWMERQEVEDQAPKRLRCWPLCCYAIGRAPSSSSSSQADASRATSLAPGHMTHFPRYLGSFPRRVGLKPAPRWRQRSSRSGVFFQPITACPHGSSSSAIIFSPLLCSHVLSCRAPAKWWNTTRLLGGLREQHSVGANSWRPGGPQPRLHRCANHHYSFRAHVWVVVVQQRSVCSHFLPFFFLF